MQNESSGRDNGREDTTHVCLLIGTVLSAFALRLVYLRGARFTEPDEFRTVIMAADTPLFSLMHRIPAAVFGVTHATALATNGVIGALAVVLTYFVGTRVAGRTGASFAALLLAVSTIDVRYSRSGYPCVLATFCLLFAVMKITEGVEKVPRKMHFAIAGVAAASAFMAYVPSYAACVALPILAVWALARLGTRKKDIARSIGAFAFAGIGTALVIVSLFTAILSGRVQIFGYLDELARYKSSTQSFIDPQTTTLGAFFGEWSRLDGILVCATIILLAVVGAAFLWRTTRPSARLFVAFPALAAAIYGGTALAGLHTLYPRHFVFTLPFLLIFSGVALSNIRPRWAAQAILVALVGVSGYRSCLLAAQTFTIEPILRFIGSHGIRLSQIASMVELHNPGDREKTKRLPYFYTQPNRTAPMIDWEQVTRMRRDEGVRFIMTSGLGSRSTLGYDDPVLKKLVPLATWPHPYRSKNSDNRTLQDFALYSLEPTDSGNRSAEVTRAE